LESIHFAILIAPGDRLNSSAAAAAAATHCPLDGGGELSGKALKLDQAHDF